MLAIPIQLFLMPICSKLCLHFHLKMDLEVSLVKKVYQQVYNPTKRCHIQALPTVHVQQSREEFAKTAAKTLFSTEGFVSTQDFVKLVSTPDFVKLFSTQDFVKLDNLDNQTTPRGQVVRN